jgi:hypothetical protein
VAPPYLPYCFHVVPSSVQCPLISRHVHPHGPSSAHHPLASLLVSLPPIHLHLSTFHHSHVPLSSTSPPPVYSSDRVVSLNRCHSSRHRLRSVHTFTPSSRPRPHPPQGFPHSSYCSCWRWLNIISAINGKSDRGLKACQFTCWTVRGPIASTRSSRSSGFCMHRLSEAMQM